MSLTQAKIATEIRERIKRWIMFRLGYPTIKVELNNAQLDIAIDEAVQRFSQWVPGGERLAIVAAVQDQSEYDLLEILPDYIQIKEVIYSPYQTDSMLTSFLGGVTTDFQYGDGQVSYFHGNGMYSSLTDYTIMSMYNKMFQRTFGRDGQWQVMGNTLHVAPKPGFGVNFGIIYQSMLIDTDVRRDEWIKEWALTEAKMALGHARKKFGSLPGPRGDISLDGDDLVNDAKEMQKELLERLSEYREPLGIQVG